MEQEIIQTQQANYPQSISNFEKTMLGFLENRNLPTDGIFSKLGERIVIFQNLDHIIENLDNELCQKSVYLSKFLAAGAAGLFDASLNYLWDETILQLRARVSQFDLEYFYDNAVGGDKRKMFKTQDDLVKLQDSELIKGARDIELISDVGYEHLSLINYMRNWASAAHPNQTNITGLQLITWLETCINQVISLPIPGGVIRIKKLLGNIRKNKISSSEAEEIGTTFVELTQDQANSLGQALFGIYTKEDTDEFIRQNCKNILPFLWGYIDIETKQNFGIKYGYFAANGEKASKQYAKQFLEIVDGLAFIPEDMRAVDIQNVISNLLIAHRGYNNFYNEVPWAKQLRSVVGNPIKIPKQINKKYVLALVECYITNGNGVCWDGEAFYKDMINSFDNIQATMVMLSVTVLYIRSNLGLPLCSKKYKELLSMVRPKITNQTTLVLFDQILNYPQYNNIIKDLKIMGGLKNYEQFFK